MVLIFFNEDESVEMKLFNSNKQKYINLIKGLALLSIKCSTDIEFFNQWTLCSDQPISQHINYCHCKTKIIDNIHVYNYHTESTAVVGNVCMNYFRNALINAEFDDRKYERLNHEKRRKCGRCRSSIRKNNKNGYCMICRKFNESDKEIVRRLMGELEKVHYSKLEKKRINKEIEERKAIRLKKVNAFKTKSGIGLGYDFKFLDNHLNLIHDVKRTHDLKVAKIEREMQEIKARKLEREHRIKNYTMKFGKYKGEPLKDIPTDYLKWLFAQTWFKDYGERIQTYLELFEES